MAQGKLITFEGPDGSGKSSVLKGVYEKLKKDGHTNITLTREPGGTPISEAIREVILDPEHTEMDPVTEALLYAASRRQHVVELIKPTLKAGEIVLSDRYVDSSLVYQGVARGLELELVKKINEFAVEGVFPDLTILVDVPAAVGLERIEKARGKRQYDRLDQESLEFHEKVRQAFLSLAKDKKRFVIIDGSPSLEEVIDQAYQIIRENI